MAPNRVTIGIGYLDTRYVNITGDTMTGGLTITPATDTLTALVVNDKDSNNVLTVDTINNFIGMGTTEPVAKLEIIGAGAATTFLMVEELVPIRFVAEVYSDVAGDEAQFNFRHARGTRAVPTATQDDDELGSIFFVGMRSNGSWAAAAAIRGYADGEFSTAGDLSDSPGRLEFLTVPDGGGTQAIRMVIDNAGFIGMGTTTPSALLHISDGGTTPAVAAYTNFIVQDTNSASNSTEIALLAGATSGISQIAFGDVNDHDIGRIRYDHSDNSMRFFTNAGEKVRITSGGLVGIGETSPTAVLHLKAGTATASTSPLKFTSGISLTTAEAGATEFTTDNLFFTITTGAARKGIVLDDGTRLTSGKIPVATTNGRLIDVTPQTELTDELTTLTHTAPSTPDYALQDLIDSSAGACFGFATKDEGNTALSVIANLQARVNELETALVNLGLLSDAD